MRRLFKRVIREGVLLGFAAAIATCTREPPTSAQLPTSLKGVASAFGPVTFVGAGDIADCGGFHGDERTADLLDSIDGTVFTLGDNAYPDGSDSDYANCYDPTWGRQKARTRPAVGNHDYYLGNADGSWRYWGSQIGDSGKYYYSFDLGAWHIVVLNSEQSFVPIKVGTPQETWLRNDLAATSQKCILAIWHEPRFYSSTSSTSSGFRPYLGQVWVDLYDAGAALILNGHSHNYERFAPQDPDGNLDTHRGIREFIIGTGGEKTYLPDGFIRANSEVRGAANGVMKFTLDDGSYTWQFVPVAGETFTDQGSGVCPGVGNIPPVAQPGGPYQSEGAVSFDGQASSDPDGDLPLTYVWDFGDGTGGVGATPEHSYLLDGVYTVILTVTDAKGAASEPASTTATIANLPPIVNAGADASVLPGETFVLSASFTDPGGIDDALWHYAINWGDGASDDAGAVTKEGPITASHTYATVGVYTVMVTVTDKDGGTGSDNLVLTVATQYPAEVLVGAGDIARCDRTNDEATASLLDAIAGTVFTTGDNVYVSGSLADFTNCYGPSWGRHQGRTRPAVGDKEYKTAGATGYFDYFGPAAGDRDKGYYSYDLGAWHIVVLNSNISTKTNSPQELWLRADLAASTKRCTLAYWHHPRFSSSGTAVRSGVKPLWDDLYASGAEIVLNGHYSLYERFAPQTPNAVADPTNGIRQFTIGTGGFTPSKFGSTPRPNSEVRQTGTYGVLKLTLTADGYSWEFVPTAGGTFTDSGSGVCH
jgi:PKD repeat protein